MRMGKGPTKNELLRKAAAVLLGKDTDPEPDLQSDKPLPVSNRTRSTDELLHDLQVHQLELEMQNEALQQTQIALEESRDRYMHLYDFAPVGYITISRDGVISEANLTATSLLGTVRSKLTRSRFETFITPAHHAHWRRRISATWQTRNEQTLKCELLLQRGDGSQFPAQLQCVVMEMTGSNPVVRIAFTDITERKHAEEQQRIAAIAFESHEGMIVTDAEGTIVSANHAFTDLTGYSISEVEGKNVNILSAGQQYSAQARGILQTLLVSRYWQGELWSRRKNGGSFAAWLTITAVTAPDGSVSHYVGAFSDTTQQSEAAAEINRLAFYDPLTQLPNRRLLQDRLNQALASASRNGVYGAILFLDLDNFKVLNDSRGHDVGDVLLDKVAQRLRINLRQGDTVARLGGDEFVMILEGLSSNAEDAAILAEQIGDKLIQAIAAPFNLGEDDFHCTTSVGVRLFSEQDTVDELLKHADLALYQAKTDGRNVVRFYDPSMQASLDERGRMKNELRHALKLDQFQLYFQPQFDNARRIKGAECLLRWCHPGRGLIFPEEFIELIERTGLIVPIGRWVLEHACAQLKAWSEHESTRDLSLAVNISGSQFHQPDFAEQIQQILENSAIDPQRLTLELKESALLDNVADSLEKMQVLKQYGIRLSIDDFGTGLSSLPNLTKFLLDQVKIDKSFVANLLKKNSDAAIVTTIITLAKSLGLSIMAEGVETEEQKAFLDNHGCPAYQGYLFSRPLSLDEFSSLANSR